MKRIVSMAAVLASLSLIHTASAQTNWGSTGAVTIALTLSYEKEGLQAKDETGKVIPVNDGGGPTFQNSFTVDTYGGPADNREVIKSVSTDEYVAKLATFKYGNADIIKVLVDSGVLPQLGRTPYYAGWSIVEVCNAEGMTDGYYARHTSREMQPIDFFLMGNPGMVGAYSEKNVLTTTSPINGEGTSSETRTLSSTYKGQGMATVPFFDAPVEVVGFLTGGTKVTAKKETFDGMSMTSFVYTSAATKLDKITGVVPLDMIIEGAMMGCVEGSISIGAGAIVDIDKFMEGPTPQ